MRVVITVWLSLFLILFVMNGIGIMISDSKIEMYHYQEMLAIYSVGLGILYVLKCIDKRM